MSDTLRDSYTVGRAYSQVCVGCGGPWPRLEKAWTAGFKVPPNVDIPKPAPVARKGKTVTGQELVEAFEAVSKDMVETVRRKNADYAGQGGNKDAFANFRMVESISGGAITTEAGMVTRMTDKLSRVISLLTSGKEAQVKDESISDTLTDLAAYAILARIYIRDGKRV